MNTVYVRCIGEVLFFHAGRNLPIQSKRRDRNMRRLKRANFWMTDDVVVEHIHEEAKMEEKENENGEKEMVEVSPAKEKVKIVKRPVSISDIHPLWSKHPNECTKEDYIEFYRKVFLDYKEPLFWIHLNMDYPFNLKGILYFPKINTEYDSIEGNDQALQ